MHALATGDPVLEKEPGGHSVVMVAVYPMGIWILPVSDRNQRVSAPAPRTQCKEKECPVCYVLHRTRGIFCSNLAPILPGLSEDTTHVTRSARAHTHTRGTASGSSQHPALLPPLTRLCSHTDGGELGPGVGPQQGRGGGRPVVDKQEVRVPLNVERVEQEGDGPALGAYDRTDVVHEGGVRRGGRRRQAGNDACAEDGRGGTGEP